MDKRYQVFISSTYEDLKEERQAIIESLMKVHSIPVGMEHFTASSIKQWEVITPLIDGSDYYLLVVAGRYGSIADNGKSYTENEFDYAVENKIPVIAFIHKSPGDLLSKYVDQNKEAELQEFREKIKSHATVEFWDDGKTLPAAILASMQNMIKYHRRPGWIRATGITDDELLQQKDKEISRLKQEIEELNKRPKGIDLEDYSIDPTYHTFINKTDVGKYEPPMYCPNCLNNYKKISVQYPGTKISVVKCPANCGWEVSNPNYVRPKSSVTLSRNHNPFF